MRLFSILGCIVLLLGDQAAAQQYTLDVTVSGIQSDKGTLYLSLYNSEKGFPKDPKAAFRVAHARIVNGISTFRFDKLPKGTYAAACYHDENGNGKLDVNFFGIPTEGTGASNNASGFLGPPKFREAKFPLDRDTAITIRIRY
ncbi:MAG TPA: DUF2141 domain-containing protein [Puia sp.]|nr:DUF2141 domain-containing protein [Puia sp.]